MASGRILAIVGESGCGKSLTALSMLGLLPKAAQVAGGTIRLGERTLTALSEAEMALVRGNDAAIIFQEPLASLNPLMRVGAQVEEALLLHRGLSRSARARRRSRRWRGSAFPIRQGGRSNIRSSCRAACASAS